LNVYPFTLPGFKTKFSVYPQTTNRSRKINYGIGERLETLFNPLYPPVLGDFVSWGIPPNPQQRGSAPLHSPVVKRHVTVRLTINSWKNIIRRQGKDNLRG